MEAGVIYRRCWKCGRIVMLELTRRDGESFEEAANKTMCLLSMPVRVSGICGGSYTVPATKEEYEQKVLEYEQSKKSLEGNL
jgi:hypothetical protein